MGLESGLGIWVWDCFWDIGSGLSLECRFGIGCGDRVLGFGLRDIVGLGFGFETWVWVWGWTSYQNIWSVRSIYGLPPEI